MDRQRDDSAEQNKDSRESPRRNTGTPRNLAPAPTTTATASTTASTTSHPSPALAPVQPRNTNPHPIPPPIHPPFHAYTPQLHPPVSTPENLFMRRNLPPFTPLPIADLYQPGQTSQATQQGTTGGSTLGAGASHAIPVSGSDDMPSSSSGPAAGLSSAKTRHTLRNRESNSNLSATASKPYIVKAKTRSSGVKSSGVKSSRVEKSKKPAESSGAATPSADELSAYVDNITDTLTSALANLEGAAQTLREVTLAEERRMQMRANAAAGGRENVADEEDEEEDEEEGMSSDSAAIVDFANKF
ncbi:hypothetical protein EAE96_005635 [Botrytis aclada]|nr:hypothetical protein EAE96_005635 [Botrytis aclada]